MKVTNDHLLPYKGSWTYDLLLTVVLFAACHTTTQLPTNRPSYQTHWFELEYCGVDQITEKPRYCNLDELDGIVDLSINNNHQVHLIVKGSALLSISVARNHARREGAIIQDYLLNQGVPRENISFAITNTYVLAADTVINEVPFSKGTELTKNTVSSADDKLMFKLDGFFRAAEIRVYHPSTH